MCNPTYSRMMEGAMGPAFPALKKATAENAQLKSQLETTTGELNGTRQQFQSFQAQQNKQPSNMGNSDPYFGRTSPKFNFRSSPFAIQGGPNQEQSDSGLNLA